MSAIRVIANVTGILLAAPIRLPMKLLNALKYVRVGTEIIRQAEVAEIEAPKKKARIRKAGKKEADER